MLSHMRYEEALETMESPTGPFVHGTGGSAAHAQALPQRRGWWWLGGGRRGDRRQIQSTQRARSWDEGRAGSWTGEGIQEQGMLEVG